MAVYIHILRMRRCIWEHVQPMATDSQYIDYKVVFNYAENARVIFA